MQIDIQYSPSFAVADVVLAGGETFQAESGAMVSMTQGVTLDTGLGAGGLMAGFKRAMMGGESFLMNTFTGHGGGGTVTLAPTMSGDVKVWQLADEAVMLQAGAFLGSERSVTVDSQFGGAKTLLTEGLFLLKCSGRGQLVVAAYGAIKERDLADGEQFTVDSGHVLGWSDSVRYDIGKVGDWKSAVLSGEGIVAYLTGPGKVWVQTRSPKAFLGWLIPQIPGLPGQGNTKTN